jgi:hypothetical protein
MKKLAELLRGENYIREALSSMQPSPAFTVMHSHHIKALPILSYPTEVPSSCLNSGRNSAGF